MSSRYDASSPKQRLVDIAERFALIDSFVAGVNRETFVADVKTRLAVVRLVEEICEAAYWFVKNARGADVRGRHPDLNFASFGGAGNIYRHQYGIVDYGLVWDDLESSPDIEALRNLLKIELSQ